MKRTRTFAATGLAAGLLAAAVSMSAFAAQTTADSAQDIALKDAGVKEKDLAFVKTEVDYDDGRQIYEVSFLTEDHIEYDYDISAENGSILKIEYDAETKFYQGNRSGKAITLSQAKEKRWTMPVWRRTRRPLRRSAPSGTTADRSMRWSLSPTVETNMIMSMMRRPVIY